MPKESTARKQEQQLFSQRILVIIDRDMTAKIPRTIWSHEKPLLEVIFGEGKVDEIDPTSLDEGYSAKQNPALIVHKPKGGAKQDAIPKPSETQGLGFLFTGDVQAEYGRLVDAYGKCEDENMSVVERVYGRFQTGQFTKLMAQPIIHDLPEAQLKQILVDWGIELTPDANLIQLAEENGVELH